MKFVIGFVAGILALVGIVTVLASNPFGITDWIEEKFPL